MVCAAGSAVITSQVMNLWRMFPTRVTTSMWDRDDLIERFLAQHDRLIAAIVEGDGAAAEREMATHIMSAAEERLSAMT
jgi:DNA-binding GntR family transcriptional regulator